jgi:hypothetical protein
MMRKNMTTSTRLSNQEKAKRTQLAQSAPQDDYKPPASARIGHMIGKAGDAVTNLFSGKKPAPIQPNGPTTADRYVNDGYQRGVTEGDDAADTTGRPRRRSR